MLLEHCAMWSTTLDEISSECCIHPSTAAAVSDQRLRELRASFRSEKPTNPGHSLLHPDPTRVPRGTASSSLPRTSCWAPQLAPPPGSSGSPSPAMSPRLCLQSPTVSCFFFYFGKSDVKNFNCDLAWKCDDVEYWIDGYVNVNVDCKSWCWKLFVDSGSITYPWPWSKWLASKWLVLYNKSECSSL